LCFHRWGDARGRYFSGKNIPLLDANNGGSGMAIPDTLQKAFDTVKNVDVIITGHSTEMSWPDLKEYADFNRGFLNDVRAAKDAGKTVTKWPAPGGYRRNTWATPLRCRSG